MLARLLCNTANNLRYITSCLTGQETLSSQTIARRMRLSKIDRREPSRLKDKEQQAEVLDDTNLTSRAYQRHERSANETASMAFSLALAANESACPGVHCKRSAIKSHPRSFRTFTTPWAWNWCCRTYESESAPTHRVHAVRRLRRRLAPSNPVCKGVLFDHPTAPHLMHEASLTRQLLPSPLYKM